METADEPQLSSSPPSSSSQKEEKSDEKEGESDENPSHVDDEETTDDVEGEKQVKRNYHLDTSHGFLREVRRIQENRSQYEIEQSEKKAQADKERKEKEESERAANKKQPPNQNQNQKQPRKDDGGDVWDHAMFEQLEKESQMKKGGRNYRRYVETLGPSAPKQKETVEERKVRIEKRERTKPSKTLYQPPGVRKKTVPESEEEKTPLRKVDSSSIPKQKEQKDDSSSLEIDKIQQREALRSKREEEIGKEREEERLKEVQRAAELEKFQKERMEDFTIMKGFIEKRRGLEDKKSNEGESGGDKKNQQSEKRVQFVLDIETQFGVRPLPVEEGDNPEILARAFCKQYKMESYISNLTRHIEQTRKKVKKMNPLGS